MLFLPKKQALLERRGEGPKIEKRGRREGAQCSVCREKKQLTESEKAKENARMGKKKKKKDCFYPSSVKKEPLTMKGKVSTTTT